jgi:hypothetical protein
MADVRLFDARKPGPSPDAMLKASDSDVLKRYDELAAQGKVRRAACSPYNSMLLAREAEGHRLVLQAFGAAKDASVIYRAASSLTTVVGNVSGSHNDDDGNPVQPFWGPSFTRRYRMERRFTTPRSSMCVTPITVGSPEVDGVLQRSRPVALIDGETCCTGGGFPIRALC